MMSLNYIRLVKQVYPDRNESIYKPIKVSASTRIAEMIPKYQKRILKHKNKMIEGRSYTEKIFAYPYQVRVFCPMVYTKVLCHACYEEICIRDLYLSKNGEHGRSKFYHISCAEVKNII